MTRFINLSEQLNPVERRAEIHPLPSREKTHKGKQTKCVLSVDVEDWFHILDIPSAPPLERWQELPSRVERNFLRLLDIFSDADVRVTCFFLGWIGQKFPNLVRAAHQRGHEIASHGYSHQLIYQTSPERFAEDARRSKNILEDAVGRSVLGYRAAGFSVTEETFWYFEKLIEAGYVYDSSVFPASRGHGGMPTGNDCVHSVSCKAGHLMEFPITVKRILGRPVCFFGGGYLRLFPYAVIKAATDSVLREGRPVTFYIHPREIDVEHPRLPMPFVRRFKSYVNLRTVEPKLRKIFADFPITTFRDLMHEFEHARTEDSEPVGSECLITGSKTEATQ